MEGRTVEGGAEPGLADLLTRLGHDLRGPLNAVTGYAEMLAEDASDEGRADVQEDLGKIVGAAGQLLGLVDDVLLLAALYDDAGFGAPSRCSVGEVLATLEEDGRLGAVPWQSQEGVGDAPSVAAPPGLLASTLSVMIRSVHARHGGRVTLLVEPHGTTCRFTARSEDGGSPSDDPASGRWQRLAAAVLLRAGPKLGSAVVRSEGPAALTVELPVAAGTDAELDALAVGPLDVGPGGSRQLRVLVADDTAVNRTVAARMLEGAGHSVSETEDGGQALRAISAGGFDLVLLDLSMPVLDGVTVAERARVLAPDPAPVMVALTAHVTPAVDSRCREAGMQAVLTKPLATRALNDVLRALGGSEVTAVPEEPAGAEAGPRRSERGGGDSAAPESPASGSSTSRPADLNRFRSSMRAAGIGATADRVLHMYQRDMPARFAELERACAAGDLDGAERAAHALKGASRQILAGAAEAAFATLEDHAGCGVLPDEQMLSIARKEFERLLGFLNVEVKL